MTVPIKYRDPGFFMVGLSRATALGTLVLVEELHGIKRVIESREEERQVGSIYMKHAEEVLSALLGVEPGDLKEHATEALGRILKEAGFEDESPDDPFWSAWTECLIKTASMFKIVVNDFPFEHIERLQEEQKKSGPIKIIDETDTSNLN
ncbi:MAG: hypothetical protein D6812_07485 [Deltaproteobacteria bacterium]|nr:MAG: hypothetical protein D6812_07485 [Deltaproteobacteria bacterium]